MFYNNKTEIEISLKYLKCFKCETSENLISIPINQVYKPKFLKKKKNNNRKEISEFYIPICLRCSLEFQRWKRFNKKYKKKNVELVFYFSLTFLLIILFLESFWLNFFLLFITGASLIHFNVQSLKHLKEMDYYPKKYIAIIDEQKLCFKSDNATVWRPCVQWIKDTLYEGFYNEKREECSNQIALYPKYCVYCGTKCSDIHIKCHKCGHFLPLN